MQNGMFSGNSIYICTDIKEILVTRGTEVCGRNGGQQRTQKYDDGMFRQQ